jgi:hypothetical protein
MAGTRHGQGMAGARHGHGMLCVNRPLGYRASDTENVSVTTFLQWSRDIEGNVTVLYSPTTAGLWQGMPLPWNTNDRQNKKKHDFVCVK